MGKIQRAGGGGPCLATDFGKKCGGMIHNEQPKVHLQIFFPVDRRIVAAKEGRSKTS